MPQELEPGEVLEDIHTPRPVTSSENVFTGHVWNVVSEQVDLGAAGVVTRDVIDHPGAVAIMAYREDDSVALVRQYRHPVRRELWEPPAGLLDVPGEDPWQAAKRELYEETDLYADQWHVLLDVCTSPGGSSEEVRVYLARDLSEVPEGSRHVRQAEEFDMPIRWVPLSTALDAIYAGGISGPTTVSGLLALDAAKRRGWSDLRPADSPWHRRSLRGTS